MNQRRFWLAVAEFIEHLERRRHHRHHHKKHRLTHVTLTLKEETPCSSQ